MHFYARNDRLVFEIIKAHDGIVRGAMWCVGRPHSYAFRLGRGVMSSFLRRYV